MKSLQDTILTPIISSANRTSTNVDMRNMVSFSLQAIAGIGSCAGTIQAQVSNDPCPGTFSSFVPVNWSNLGSPLTFTQSSTASNQLLPKVDSSYTALRAIFTDSSGGTNTALISLQFSGLGL